MRGFVLVELIIVLFILSVLFFYLIPSVTNFHSKTVQKDINKLNKIIEIAYNLARKRGEPIEIWGVEGSKLVHLNGKNIELSEEIFEVKINGNSTYGLKYDFYIYPDGIMDKVVMELANYKKIISKPLLMRFYLE